MKTELEEAIKRALETRQRGMCVIPVEILKQILNYIDNSTSNEGLYDLAREMRKNSSHYWADKLCEKIKK